MKLKRMISGILALILLCQGQASDVKAEGKDFDQWMMEEFVETMESDYLTLHYTLVDYERYGIEKPVPSVGELPSLDYSEDIAEVEETLRELSEFDYASLDDTQKHDYDTYKFYLESMRNLLNYPMYDFYFLPNNGIQSNLITNFTEFIFYQQQDIDDYLSVIESVPAYMDGALEVTRQQVAQGYFMTDDALDQTLDGIAKFVAKTEDNPLLLIFNQNIDAFEGLSDEQRAAYKEKNRDLILNHYIPSYQRLAAELETFRGTRTAKSLYEMPDGKKYYAALLRLKSSSSQTVQEMFELTNAQLVKLMEEYTNLYLKSDEDKMNEVLPETDPEQILHDLQDQLQEYPAGPEVAFTANYLDKSVANDGIVAYYMQPPIDDIADNVIKINGDNVNSTNEMFTTLAHEGFPGHLFQITWYLHTNPAPLRTQLNNIGYTEGWAMYSEDVAWAYSDLNEQAQELNRIDTNLNYILSAQADLLVNGMGWNESKLGDYYEKIGLNAAIASAVMESVTTEPGTIVPYGVGLAYYLDIRDKAKASLADQYDVVEFNRMLLTYGDRPFDIVYQDLENYIHDHGGKIVAGSSAKGAFNPAILGIAGAGIAILFVAIVLLRRKKHQNI